jgi:light-regulated signal transduction histidine kinase (bacteriophytochrome)
VAGEVSFAPVALQQVVEDTLASLDTLIHERGAQVTSGELPVVHGNGPLLAQLFQNLLSNAIKFCEGKTPCIEISSVPQEGDSWLVALADNGIGIPEKWLGSIFQPLKRLHAMSRFEGTGLGLATCKKIVERHHGRIWCFGAREDLVLPQVPCCSRGSLCGLRGTW